MHDETYITADIYSVFSRIMDLGIKELFGTTSDVSAIKNAYSDGADDSKKLF